MTCREKLKLEHPEKVSEDCMGGCIDCPHTYGYIPKGQCLCHCTEDAPGSIVCGRCWDQEIPEPAKENVHIPNTLNMIDFVNGVMAEGNKTVSIRIENDSINFSIYPYPKEGEDK